MASLAPTRAAAAPRIAAAHFYVVRVPLRFSVEHALAARTHNVTGFLLVEADDGTTGIGEVLARDYVTGETLDDCERYLQEVSGRLLDAGHDDPLAFLQSLWVDEPAAGRSGALCALELALLDLWGKSAGRSIASLLGHPPPDAHRPLVCSATYPIARGAKRAVLHLFYRTWMRMDQLKVKGTGQIDEDLAYLAAVRRAYPYPVTLRVDLNGSLRPEDADAYCTRMLASPYGVRWIEQPFARDDLESSGRFQRRFSPDLVFCGDESICTEEDLDRALVAGAFRAVNLRVAKHGGLQAALRLYQRASAAGLETQVGCLVGESSILAYAGLQLAALVHDMRYFEGCFGRYLVRWDVIQPSLTFSRGGRVSLDRLPSVGLVPPFDAARLRRAAIRATLLGRRA
jgi:L-alanine-DL-glutamate epimerase-like enolase superfamily enzyme